MDPIASYVICYLGVISEGQTTETCLCLRTFVISENCSQSTTNLFAFVFDEQVNLLQELFQLLQS